MKLRFFPKSGTGNLAAAFCAAFAFLAACGWGLPEWAGCAAFLYGAANVLLAVLRAMQRLCGERPAEPVKFDLSSVSAISLEFFEERR